MNNLNVYMKIANEEIKKRGLKNIVPLYPMLRFYNDKLNIFIPFADKKDRVWDSDSEIKPKYWMLIDINTEEVLEFNETKEKDFIIDGLVIKKLNDKQKEITKYSIEKVSQYKKSIIEDIRKSELPLQKKLVSILGNEIDIDGEKVDINEFLLANFEEDINIKVNELVKVLIHSKYGSITYYYDILFEQVIEEYISMKSINVDKIKLCIEIMNNYYEGVIGIENIFNIIYL